MVGPATDKHKAPTHPLKLYVRAVIESKAWPTIVQLRGNHSYKPWLGLKLDMQTVAWYPIYIQPFYNVLLSFWIDH